MANAAMYILYVLKVMHCIYTKKGNTQMGLQIICFGSMFNEIEMLQSVDEFMI